MKNLLLATVAILGIVFGANAQTDRFTKAMQATLSKMDSTKTQQDFLNQAGAFQRIAIAEKSKWEPFYYSAYCRIIAAFMEQDKDKVDAILDPADEDLTKALAIDSKNSEVYAIQAMLYQARIQVSFTRGMKYSGMASEAIEKAIVMNPANPRAHYMQAQNIFYTPAMFGGGAEKALPHYQKALALFNAQQDTVRGFAPRWGKKQTIAMIKACETKS